MPIITYKISHNFIIKHLLKFKIIIGNLVLKLNIQNRSPSHLKPPPSVYYLHPKHFKLTEPPWHEMKCFATLGRLQPFWIADIP